MGGKNDKNQWKKKRNKNAIQCQEVKNVMGEIKWNKKMERDGDIVFNGWPVSQVRGH